jgi:AcrR family transcriptional regulator
MPRGRSRGSRGTAASQTLPAHTGKPPASARGARTRDALVRAAQRVFERDGFLEARITDISAEAGVAAGSFYTYFATKEAAFAAVIEEIHEETLHPTLEDLADPADPVSVIETSNRAYLVAYRRNAKLMGLLEQVALINDEFLELRLRRAQTFAERNATAIRALQQRGLANPELDPLLSAHAINAMVSRTAYLAFVHGGLTATLDELVTTLTQLWTGALGVSERPGSAGST